MKWLLHFFVISSFSTTDLVDSYPCGTIALATLLHCLGSDVDAGEIDAILGRRSFHSMAEIKIAGKQLGIDLIGLKILDYGDLQMSPAIMRIDSERLGHFIVLRPLDARDQLVQIIDPTHGVCVMRFRSLKKSKGWTGQALIPSRLAKRNITDFPSIWFGLFFCFLAFWWRSPLYHWHHDRAIRRLDQGNQQ